MCGRGHELWGVVYVAGGACVTGGSTWWGCVHGRVHAWQGGMYGRGACMRGMCGRGVCMVGTEIRVKTSNFYIQNASNVSKVA